MEDRLAELKTIPTSPSCTDIEGFIPDFNKKANQVQANLNKVKENTKTIIQLKEKYIKATSADEEKENSEDLNKAIQSNTRLCNSIKSDLDQLEENVKRSKKDEPKEPETRIKDINFKALNSKFFEILKESQNAQVEYKAVVKKKLGRHVKVIDPTLTADQVNEICDDPQVKQSNSTIFSKKGCRKSNGF